MPMLKVNNRYTLTLPGLGKIVPFSQLSQKTVTKTVRANLRKTYGISNVEVSCHASFLEGVWNGRCKINGIQYNYQIYP